MGKRSVRGQAIAEVPEKEEDTDDEASELGIHSGESEELFDEGDIDDDSDAIDLTDEEEDEEEDSDAEPMSDAEGNTGLAGLDAIIAASRRTAVSAESEDEDEELEAALDALKEMRDNKPEDELPAGEAMRERRRSGKLSSTSLMLDDTFLADAGSDSSEDERPDRNTIGNVPLEWYNEEEHIGYNRDGEKLIKRARADKLDALIARNDSASLALRTVYDPYNDEEMTLSREELKTLMNIHKGRLPEVQIDPYEDLVDWYSNTVDPFPMQNANEPKRRFMPSKWEEKKVVKLVRALRRGWIKPRKETDEEEEPPVYMLWDDNAQSSDKTGAGLTHISAPKADLPGHEESYNPPQEFLPTDEEKAAYALMDDEDKAEKGFIPRSHDCLRRVPQYERCVQERFERCLDLYLCPRVRNKRIQHKPQDLVPKSLPKPQDLKPFPTTLCVTYEGHRSKVRCVAPDLTGQWLLTGSDDGTMRMWEVITGRCTQVWNLGSKVHRVAWCPDPATRLASCVFENKVALFASGLGNAAVAEAAALALTPKENAASEDEQVVARWVVREDGGMEVVHNHQLRQFSWHGRGDYFAAVAPGGATQSVVVHQLSKHNSQNPFRKNRGRVACCTFHPTKPFFLVATENNVRIYNLAKQTLAKKLLAGGGTITSMSVHPSGDHVLIGTADHRCLWFDLDLSSKPYKVMKYHEAAVRGVSFHRKYPLFASGSDDASAQVFHGMVYSDLMTNPLIVPVKIIRGHTISDYAGVLDVAFHPTQPWLFTAGGDGKACLYVE